MHPSKSEIWFHRYQVDGATVSLDENGFETARALNVQTEEQVVIRRACLEDFDNLAVFQFKNQLRLFAEVSSPFFWSPIEWGDHDGCLYCVQSDQSISQMTDFMQKSENRSSLSQWIEIARMLARALQEVHLKGCTLGTLQPENVFFDGDRLLVNCPGPADFIRKASNTQELQFVKYASPELLGAIGEDVGPASDLYSMGVLLFWIIAGRVPFDAENVGDIIFQHLTQEPSFQGLNDVPETVRKIVSCLLDKEPHQRYQSAHALVHDINQLYQANTKGEPLESIVIRRADTRAIIQDPQMVGRENEMELLSQLLDQTMKGHPDTAVVLGPSGIGKTRTVTEILREATRKGFTIYQGRASDQAGQKPMQAILQVVAQLTRAAGESPELARRIDYGLMGFQNEIATIAPELAGVLGWKSDVLAGPDELGAGRVNKALATVLSLLNDERPVMIWIDDCHWLDSRSLDIISMFQPTGNQCLILTMRPDEGVSPEVLERVPHQSAIHLAKLNSQEVQALVESMAGLLPSEIVQTVVQLSAGSPFMASAILRGIGESGGMVFDEGRWKAVPEKLADIQASSTAADALLQRLEKVPIQILSQLSVAAVIGKEFDAQTLVELSGLSFTKTQSNFEWCRKQRLVWAKPGGEFAFVHDSIRETLIRYLSVEKRMELNRDLAELLQRNEPDRKFAIAHHFASAGEHQRALPYAVQAAEKARDQFSLDAAKKLLGIAYAGVGSEDTRQTHAIESAMADVLMLDGEYEEAENWYEKAASNAFDPTTKARTAMKRGELEFKRGNKEDATAFCELAVAELGMKIPRGRIRFGGSLFGQVITQVGHSLFPNKLIGRKGRMGESEKIYCRVMGKLAHSYWFTHSKYWLLWAHLANLNTAEKFEPTALLGQAYSDHAPAMSLLPWHDRAVKYAKRSLQVRRQMNDVWGQGQTRDFYSIVLYSSSKFEECIEQAQRAEEILNRTGDQWEVNIARYQRAASMYRLGDLDGALKLARRTYDASKAIGDYQSTGNILDIWVRAGLGPIPHEILELEQTRSLQDCQSKAQILLAAGVNSLWENDYTKAVSCFQSAIQGSIDAGVCNTYVTPNYAWLVTAMRLEFEAKPVMSRETGRRAAAKILKAAKQAVRKTRPYRNDLPHALRELAMAYALNGKDRLVRQTLESSLLEAKSQYARYEAALTRQMMGAIGAELGWADASELAEQAEQDLEVIQRPVLQQHEGNSLSLVDRFDSLLNAGREISVALDRNAIFEETCRASEKLLRGQRNLLIMAKHLSGDSTREFDVDVELCRKALQTRETMVADVEAISDQEQQITRTGAFLCSPIVVNQEAIACLYVANDLLTGLFGDNEIRIAEYLTSAAGAALEKARGFQELAELNQTLEHKVQERTQTVEARSQELEATANQLLKAQEQLELARDSAESANEAKSSFLARMSHEIRTPISAILGFTELMLRGVVRDPDQQHEKLRTIHASGKHLLQLINDLLDISKIEAGKMEVEKIDCEPGKLTHDVLESLEAQASEKSVNLGLEIKGNIPRTIQSDPTRLRQVLTNLVGNAIKFTRRGSVTVTLSANSNGQFQFDVADTGIGMTESQVHKIFDPFSQADSSTTRKFGGTGLGLSISKRLTEAMGGKIGVASALGKGSTFTVAVEMGDTGNVPWLDAHSFEQLLHGSEADEWGEINLQGLRVLVVDDSETNRDLLSIVLREAGVQIEQVENGLLACEFLKKRGHQVDVVLMDMQMPVMDGYSATRRLREAEFTKPIFALTANSMKGDSAKCIQAGCSDFVSKPIDFEVLLEKLNRLPCNRENREKPAEDNSLMDIVDSVDSVVIPDCFSNAGVDAEADIVRYQGFEIPTEEPFREISCRFVDKVFNRLDEFVVALQANDFEKLGDLAHWVKGTGGTVGLHQLSEVAESLDMACKSESKPQAEASLNDFMGLFAEVVQ